MLRKFKMGGVILGALLALVGCQSEKLVNDGGSQQGQQFTLTASRGVMSRTHLGSDGKQTVWSEGDQIHVSSLDGTVVGTLILDKADIGKPSGKFSGFVFGDTGKLNGGYSVFPVPEKKDGKYILDLSVLSGGDELDAPFIGPIEGTNVNFNHTCGIFNITNLDNPDGKSITISAKSNGNDYGFKNIATVVVDNNGARLEYSTSSTTGNITLNNIKSAKNKTIYIPYFIDEDVTLYVDGIEEATVKKRDFLGNIKESDNSNKLYFSSTVNGFIVPPTLDITDANKKVETKTETDETTNEQITTSTVTLSLSNSSNNNIPDDGNTGGGDEGNTPQQEPELDVVIPSISEVIEDSNLGNTPGNDNKVEVVVELPKVETTQATSTIIFEEVPENVTIKIAEENKTTGNSVKELTVVIPSSTTEEEVKEQIVVDMPETTVTVKSENGSTLFIKDMVASTSENTLIINSEVKITNLSILQGNIELFGTVRQIKRDGKNKDNQTMVTLYGNATVGNLDQLKKDSLFLIIDNRNQNTGSNAESNSSGTGLDFGIVEF